MSDSTLLLGIGRELGQLTSRIELVESRLDDLVDRMLALENPKQAPGLIYQKGAKL